MKTTKDEPCPYVFNPNGDVMFTREGNRKVSILMACAKSLKNSISREILIKMLKAGMKEIDRQGHKEVYDTVVREYIAWKLGISAFDI